MRTLTGFYPDLSNEAYHGGPGLSASEMSWMSQSLEYYRWRKDHPPAKTRDMTLGSVTHLVLEARLRGKPEMITEQVMVFSDAGPQSKAFKDVQAKNPEKYVVTQEDFDLARRMIDAVLEKSEVAAWFTQGVSEPSIFAEHPETGVLMKCRPDYLSLDRGLSINFKTTTDASEEGFLRSVKMGRFDWQSAWYLEVLRLHFNRNFDEIHVVVEKNADEPCLVQIYTIADEELEFARMQYTRLLPRYLKAMETGIWPGASLSVKSITLPPWSRKVVDDE
jgi:PDDEXK-like domain of unknown function (DUF3799)